jgi:hypothetical protein
MESEREALIYGRLIARKRRARARLLLLLLLGFSLIVVAVSLGSLLTGVGGSLAIILALVLQIVGEKIGRTADRDTEIADRYARGADAEEAVARILAGQLADSYFAFHDVPCPNGNIDHVVISRRGGVFAIETKSSTGSVYASDDGLIVDGHAPSKDFIRQALRNSMWLKDRIGEVLGERPYVTSILLFPNAYVGVRRPIQGVIVSSAAYLPRALDSGATASYQRDKLWTSRHKLRDALTSKAKFPPA